MKLHENIGRACPGLFCPQPSGPLVRCSEFRWTGHWRFRGFPPNAVLTAAPHPVFFFLKSGENHTEVCSIELMALDIPTNRSLL